MSRLLLFNKPFRVLSQFTDDGGRSTLMDYIQRPGFYAAGRLDYDSEGLLILTDDGKLQQRISAGGGNTVKRYWAQVEGLVNKETLAPLTKGLALKDGPCLPATANPCAEPELWTRQPPIRERKNQPTSWVDVGLREGRNRQVRRMLAAVGHPVLRLVRHRIGDWALDGLAPGEYCELELHLPTARRTAAKKRRPRQ